MGLHRHVFDRGGSRTRLGAAPGDVRSDGLSRHTRVVPNRRSSRFTHSAHVAKPIGGGFGQRDARRLCSCRNHDRGAVCAIAHAGGRDQNDKWRRPSAGDEFWKGGPSQSAAMNLAQVGDHVGHPQDAQLDVAAGCNQTCLSYQKPGMPWPG